jgi:predicted Zn-dependent protease
LFEEAMHHLEAAVALAPDDPAMHGERGIALALKGDAAGAITSMELALDLAPEDSWTRLLVGLLHLELGDVEEGATALLEAAAERDTDFEAQVLAALAAATQGWEDRAHEALARADLADEGRDIELLAEIEERLAVGPAAARELLFENLAPAILHERLIQPL